MPCPTFAARVPKSAPKPELWSRKWDTHGNPEGADAGNPRGRMRETRRRSPPGPGPAEHVPVAVDPVPNSAAHVPKTAPRPESWSRKWDTVRMRQALEEQRKPSGSREGVEHPVAQHRDDIAGVVFGGLLHGCGTNTARRHPRGRYDANGGSSRPEPLAASRCRSAGRRARKDSAAAAASGEQ